MSPAPRMSRQQEAEHAHAYARVLRLARSTSILRGRDDVAADVTSTVVMRLLSSPPPPDAWERTARRWIEGEAKALLRAERRHAAALRREAAAMTEATHQALPVSGRGRRERPPRGFRRDADGWLREGPGHPATMMPPSRRVTDADRRAAVALAQRALMLLAAVPDQPGVFVVNGVSEAPAQWLDELRAAFLGAFGYDAEDDTWVSLARRLVIVVSEAHRAPRDEYDSMADVMREMLPRGAGKSFSFVTPEWLDAVHRASQLGRGGGRGKGKSVERAVLDALNAERKRRKLRPLPPAVLAPAQTRKRTTRE